MFVIFLIFILGARGANLWLRNSKGDLPLHEAVASGRRELVKWLLDGRPSQVNATNHEGRTPLHIAAATDNADLCRLLLDRGAEVNPIARSSKNEPLTPLDCAASRGHRSTAKYIQMHGGLPASKLANTQIIIDGAQITALPTRRVTSTKIDVRDKIRIEKREVVELSSPAQERRRIKDRNDSDTTSSSSPDRRGRKRSDNKYSDRYYDRRKRLMESQKSFSDGYDTELEGYQRDHSHDRKYRKGSKKSRSKSEPRESRRSKSSSKQHRHRSGSESSQSESYSERKKSKSQRKRSKKRTTSTTESSDTESSERRSTKRKGKKTSIHIENDDEKQSVNIVKYKGIDNEPSFADGNKDDAGIIEVLSNEVIRADTEKEDNQLVKSKTLSETETDTLSVKTNMIVTEALIHMERESSKQGSSEITVNIDSSNNVSIETANLSVSHKDMTDESVVEKAEIEDRSKEDHAANITITADSQNENNALKFLPETRSSTLDEPKLGEEAEVETMKVGTIDRIPTADEVSKESNNMSKESEGSPIPEEEKLNESLSNTLERSRKRSFQVLSGPEDVDKEMATASTDARDKTANSQDKSGSPTVSFSNKDEIFNSKDSNSLSDRLLGEEVLHSEVGPETNDNPDNLQKDSSNIISSEEKRKDYASTTGSSTEVTQTGEKGLVTIIDGQVSPSDRAVQQVIMENLPEDYDINLPLAQTSPKRIRKTSKDSQISSRKSSIYETESYKVLSDIASAPDTGSPGILKKVSKLDVGSMEDENDPIENKLVKEGFIARVPSVSDNEIYSHSEVNGRRKRFRKKGRTKSRTTIRSKSENSERGYESSGLMDSGFEPSPRAMQRRIMSPRLAAYYQQRNASGRFSGKSDSRIPVRKPGDKNAVDMKSVTQRIQTNMRR